MTNPASYQPVDRIRYTDNDIRADFGRLHSIAATYLNRYCGTFQPLRNAQAVVRAGDLLEVQQLRIVCNAMIQDFGVRNMPDPQGHLLVFDAASVVEEPTNVVPMRPRRGSIRKIPEPRPLMIDLQAKLNSKRPYWYSIVKNAYLVHIAHSVGVRYYTEQYYDDREWFTIAPPFHERFEVKPKALCKSWYSWPRGLRTATPEQAAELVATNKKWCGICAEEAAQSGWEAPV